MERAGPDSEILGSAVFVLEDTRKHIVAARDMLRAAESKLVSDQYFVKGFLK